jgi:hypothetical protein
LQRSLLAAHGDTLSVEHDKEVVPMPLDATLGFRIFIHGSPPVLASFKGLTEAQMCHSERADLLAAMNAPEPSTTVSLQDVQSRWAYGEITDSDFSACYDNPFCQSQLNELRNKRRSGVAFAELTAEDRQCLAFMCRCVRTSLLTFVARVDQFREIHLSKTDLARVLVPRIVSNLPAVMRFKQYIDTQCPAPGDARNVSPKPGGYHAPTDPLTVGRFSNKPVLLDGYHRAASFWKFAPEGSSISAYIPEPLDAASLLGREAAT